MAGDDLVLIDEVLWMLARKTGQQPYDFPVWELFPCKRPNNEFRFDDRYREAESDYSKAVQITESLKPNTSRLLGSLMALAEFYCKCGLYKEARPLLNQMVDIIRKGIQMDPPPNVDALKYIKTTAEMNAFYFLANCEYFQGRYDQAKTLFERAQALMKDAKPAGKGASSSDVWSTDISSKLINISRQTGKYAEAESRYKRVLSYGGGTYVVGKGQDANVCDLALLYDMQGKKALAQSWFKLVLDKNAASEQSNGQAIVDCETRMRNLTPQMVAQKSASKLPLSDVILGALNDSSSIAAAETLNSFADVYMQAGQLQAAEKLLASAVTVEKRINKQPLVLEIDTLELSRTLRGLQGVKDKCFAIQEQVRGLRAQLRAEPIVPRRTLNR